MNFKDSETKVNLMRAFAGESQARNRYTFAASEAIKQKQFMLADVFIFTANQEKEHALIFYNHLKELEGQHVEIKGDYPLDNSSDLLTLLKRAQHNEYEEYEDVYAKFSDKASQEGFNKVAQDFMNIARIEKTHGERFGLFASMLEDNKLYNSSSTSIWTCLNCGFIYEGTQVPRICPVCSHDQGYFILQSLSPFSK